MASVILRPNVQQSSSVPPDTTSSWRASTSNSSGQAYHATGVWGKRGMTLQELTRAFDAYNDHEEREAVGMASSEDYTRKLVEPLREVKTVFLDLDGLRPSGSAIPVPVLPSSTSLRTSCYTSCGKIQDTDEFGCIVRTSVGDVESSEVSGSSAENFPELCRGVDEDTIKPSHKRRKSLSAVSLPETPTAEYTFGHGELDERPSSRLGFYGVEDEDGAHPPSWGCRGN